MFLNGHSMTTWYLTSLWTDLWMWKYHWSFVEPSSWRWGHIQHWRKLNFVLSVFFLRVMLFVSAERHSQPTRPAWTWKMATSIAFRCFAEWRKRNKPRRARISLLIMDFVVVSWLSWPLQHHNHPYICTVYIYIMYICIIFIYIYFIFTYFFSSVFFTTVVDVLHEDGWYKFGWRDQVLIWYGVLLWEFAGLSCAGHTGRLAFLFSDSSVIDQGTVVKNPEGFSSRGWA